MKIVIDSILHRHLLYWTEKHAKIRTIQYTYRRHMYAYFLANNKNKLLVDWNIKLSGTMPGRLLSF